MSMLSTTVSQNADRGVREITFGQAIREALAEEMRRDPRVFIMGEDVAEAGTPLVRSHPHHPERRALDGLGTPHHKKSEKS